MGDAGVPEFGNLVSLSVEAGHSPCPSETYRITTQGEAQHKGYVGYDYNHSHSFGPKVADAKWYETQVRHQKTELEAKQAQDITVWIKVIRLGLGDATGTDTAGGRSYNGEPMYSI